jgi:glycosyltransferase involved in cell wall biosynthesis
LKVQRPLVSFYVIAYNQEEYVRQAVEGALRQTYQPLEIILSDDCSVDRTFSIMEQMAGAYVGPHEIVVKRNKTNLGIGAHINSVLDVCRGEIIVASAADDWSVPDRVHRLFDWWTTNAPCAALVYSNLLEVDCSGNPLNTLDFRKLNPRGPSNTRGVVAWTLADHIDDRSLPLTGASFAYRRAVFDSCGPLWPGVIFEDNVFNVRAEVMGGVALCPEALVYHRRHDEQVTNIYGSGDIGKNLNRRRQVKWNEGQTLRENRADMGIFFSQGLIAPDLYRRAQSWWDKRIKKAEVEYDLEFGVWPGRVLSLLKYRYLSRPITSNRRLLFRSLAPDWVYTFALRALAVARTL